MNEGQERDYAKLRDEYGLEWCDAMDFTQSHPFGYSSPEEVRKYALSTRQRYADENKRVAMNFLEKAEKQALEMGGNTAQGFALISIAQSLNKLVGEHISVDELRIFLEEFDGDFETWEEIAAKLVQRFDIRRKA